MAASMYFERTSNAGANVNSTRLTRRTVLKTAALASSTLAAPFVHGAYAAGKLSCGFWDHWVPTATGPLEQLCREWAAKEKVDLTVDFITSNGDKDLLTMAAEAQAESGHDVLQFTSWYATGQAENLEPVDDHYGQIRRHQAGARVVQEGRAALPAHGLRLE
jgi:ABC-type glycerol-3-phosphate transport system substrate-binding protein